MGYYQSSKSTSFRVYDGYEKHKFTLEAIQFIHWLEKSEIIDPYLREIIIHHAIALDEPIIDMPEIKWVSLMVLFGHPGKQTQLALLEDMILFDTNTRAH